MEKPIKTWVARDGVKSDGGFWLNLTMMLVFETSSSRRHLFSSVAEAESRLDVICVEHRRCEFGDGAEQRFEEIAAPSGFPRRWQRSSNDLA